MIDLTNISGSDEEAEVRKNTPISQLFNFFGSLVKLHIASKSEKEQWRYFYKDHLVDGDAKADIEVFLLVDKDHSSFIESIFRKDYSLKMMYVSTGNDFLIWGKFEEWSGVESPIPPFSLPPLIGSVAVFNGSTVRAKKTNKCITFLAPPYQGKSTLANAFVRRGGSPFGDNLTIVQRENLFIEPYLTPTGIRAETVEILPELQAAIKNVPEDRITVSEVTGTVYLLHFDEIFDFNPADRTQAGIFVHLVNNRGSLDKSYSIKRVESDDVTNTLSDFLVAYSGNQERDAAFVKSLAKDRRIYELHYDLLESDIDMIVDDLERLSG